MLRLLVSAGLYLAANAVGLFFAMVVLPGFRIDTFSFVATVLVFTAIEVVAAPLLAKISLKSMPAMSGGVALIATFVGLLLTSRLLDGFTIGGTQNLLLATFIVWLGAFLAGVILPMVAFKKHLENRS